MKKKAKFFKKPDKKKEVIKDIVEKKASPALVEGKFKTSAVVKPTKKKTKKVSGKVSGKAKPKKEKGLTEKVKFFCREYMIDLNGKQAAIRAGYSLKTAENQASRLLSNDKVKAFVQELMDKRSEAVEITANLVLGNILEIEKRCMQRVPVMIREGKRMVQKMEENDEGKEVGVWEFREMGALRANELLGRHLKLFTDKLQLAGPKDGPIQYADISKLSNEDLARLISDERNQGK